MDEMRSTSGEGHPVGGDALRNEHRLWRGGFAYWAVWTAGCLAFPIAGLAGLAAAGGRVDGPVAALAGGAVTGLVIGAGQALAARGRLPLVRWTLATGAGVGVGLLAGAAIAGYRTGLGQLALQGAITGVFVGLAQAVSLPSAAGRALGVGGCGSPTLGAGLDGDHAGGDRCEQPLHDFRAQRSARVQRAFRCRAPHAAPAGPTLPGFAPLTER
jgi:hypothetical protein